MSPPELELEELEEELDELLELELDELLELEELLDEELLGRPVELDEELLELDELDDELLELELLVVLTPGQPRIRLATKRPDSVRLLSFQPPVALAPTFKKEAPSFLSFNAQLAWLMLLLLRKFIQVLVSLEFTAPSPSAFTAPHSVTNKAIPRSSAVCALARSSDL